MRQSQSDMKREFEEDSVLNIQSERENDYGDAKASHKSIADFWNVYLKRKRENGCNNLDLDHVDVANMLELMKMSRFSYQRKYDSALDKAAYADFVLQFIGTPD